MRPGAMTEAAVTGESNSILLVTADPFLERVLNHAASAVGYELECARTNGEARVKVRQRTWGVLVVDAAMGGGKGAEFMRMVARDPDLALPAVVLGAAGSTAQDLAGTLEGLDVVISPTGLYTGMDLAHKIVSLLGRSLGRTQDLLARDLPFLPQEGAFGLETASPDVAIGVLSRLAILGETGSIRRNHRGGFAEIRLVRGRLVAASTPRDSDLLGHMAVHEGLISESLLKELLGIPSPLPLGFRLVRRGLVAPAAIRALIKAQVKRRALSVLELSGGRLEWSPEPEPMGDPVRVMVPAIPVAWEATASLAPWVPGAMLARPVSGRSMALVLRELPLTEPQRRFLLALDGVATVRIAAEYAGLSLWEALGTCPRLHAVGAISDPADHGLSDLEKPAPQGALPSCSADTVAAAGTGTSHPEEQAMLQSLQDQRYRDMETAIQGLVGVGAWDQVVEKSTHLLEAGVSSPAIYTWLALARMELGESPQQIAVLFHKALAADPDFAPAHRGLARLFPADEYRDVIAYHERLAQLVEGTGG